MLASKYLGGYIFCQSQNIAKKRSVIYISNLAYSLHLGSDKNKRNSARSSAKNNAVVQRLYLIIQYKMLKDYLELINTIIESMIISKTILKL